MCLQKLSALLSIELSAYSVRFYDQSRVEPLQRRTGAFQHFCFSTLNVEFDEINVADSVLLRLSAKFLIAVLPNSGSPSR